MDFQIRKEEESWPGGTKMGDGTAWSQERHVEERVLDQEVKQLENNEEK
jgi:hypothetical protein